jgi:hypothetical protein
MRARRGWTHRGYRSEELQAPPPVEHYAEARGMEMHGGNRTREELSESDRLVVRRREDSGATRPCPRACPGAGYRGWDFAGIDARGYLVWPGKVEY